MSTTASPIEWTDRTWNPVRGCSRISPGCENCYAEQIAGRFSGPGLAFEGFATRGKNGARWTRKLALVEDALLAPLGWKKPARVFVNSMSDLFHEAKRADRMHAYFTQHVPVLRATCDTLARLATPNPLPNVWLGVSIEDQERANERIPHLLATPAAVRFLSCEPLLGPINLRDVVHDGIGRDALRVDSDTFGARERHLDWVIVGGESGRGARISDAAHMRRVVEQCREADVPCFVKQLGAICVDSDYCGLSPLPLKHAKGGDPDEWPNDLRGVREFPEVQS